MNRAPAASDATRWASTLMSRLTRAWRLLAPERRLAALAAAGLFVALFLPWYQETVVENGAKTLQTTSATFTGWAAFSFVEAAVLLVAVGVLVLLIQRAEGRAFHLPGGDGTVVMAGGAWTCLLIVWRIFDKQGTTSHGQLASTSGIEWGILGALAVAALLTYAGSRIRAAHQPEPPLPGEELLRTPTDPPVSPPPSARADPTPGYDQRAERAARRRRATTAADEQLTIPLERED